MEFKTIKDFLYKEDGEFSVLYDSIKEMNNNFELLLNVKKASVKLDLHKNMLKQLEGDDKNIAEALINKLIELIFKDIKQCHKKIYS